MSFKKMNAYEAQLLHERSCIILYHFTPQEIKLIQNAGRMSGITESIVMGPMQAGTVVREILEDHMQVGEEGIKEKAIFFNHIAPPRMNAFIEALKKCRMRRPLMAVVTENAIDWTINEWLGHLLEERSAVRKQQFSCHTPQ